MKFFVSTVLEVEGEYEITGDVFFVEDRKVRIAGVEHTLHYGDTVQHGDFAYYVNEDSVSTDGFTNQFTKFWNLTDGQLPDDGEKYFVLEDTNTTFSSDMLLYQSLGGKIASRDFRGVQTHAFEGDNIYCTEEKKPYTIDLVDLSELSGQEFALRIEEKKESELRTIIENQELIETIAEKVRVPNDGNDGKDGERGATGEPGRSGKDGERGERGLTGKDGRDGLDGSKGEPGSRGERGSDGKDGIDGKDGKRGPRGLKGDTGATGPKGDKGDRGEPGPAGITEQRIINDKIEIDAVGKKEWEQFRKLDQVYKQRLNTQLSSLGGGGSDALMENRDVAYVDPSQISNGQFLAYDASLGTFALTDISTLQGESGSNTSYPVYIQNTAPTTSATKYMWIETAISGDANCFSIWFEDSL